MSIVALPPNPAIVPESDESRISKFTELAVTTICSSVPDAVRNEVLNRAAQTASKILEVKSMADGTPLEGSGVADLNDLVSHLSPEQVRLAALCTRFATFPKPKPDSFDGFPANPAPSDFLEKAEIVLQDGPLPAETALRIVAGIDKAMYPRVSKEREGEYVDLMHLEDGHPKALAILLYENLGDEVLDIALALALFGVNQDHQDDPSHALKLRAILNSDLILKRDVANKKELFHLLAGRGEFDRSSERSILEWAFGKTFIATHCDGEEFNVGAVLNKIRATVVGDEAIQDKIIFALKRMAQTPDRAVAGAISRQGTVTLGLESTEVTEYEWMKRVRHQVETKFSDPEVVKILADNPNARARHQESIMNIARFFAAHPTEPDASATRRLNVAIGSHQLREELQLVDTHHNPFAYVALQQEIAHRVVRHVSYYHSNFAQEEASPDWEKGFPTHVVDRKDTSCFSGPWLIASQLLQAGVRYDDLFYCNVLQASQGLIGGHGSIAIKTKTGQLHLYDTNMGLVGVNMRGMPIQDKKMAHELDDLLHNKRRHPVFIDAHRELSRQLQVHPVMHVMPLLAGFASGHLLHVGGSLLHEGKLDEALYAFELGLGFCKDDPDLHYNAGLAYAMKGDLLSARRKYSTASGIFDNHLWSRFGLANIALAQGDTHTAKKTLTGIAGVKEKLYNGKELQDEAKAWCKLDDSALIEAWRASRHAQLYAPTA